MADRTDLPGPAITQDMIRLYDDYTHLTLDRRGFMDKLTRLAGSGAAAAAIVPMLAANQARAAIVSPDDERLKTDRITFPGGAGEMSGYLAVPADAAGPLPGVVVVHENRGLNPHIEDVVRRVALEGFVALGPDFLSPAGGTPDDEDQAREMIRALDPEAAVANGVAAVSFLKDHAGSTGKVGIMGFCWGGGMVNSVAVASDQLDAGTVFYGRSPESDQVANIKATMLMHYAGLDDRINAGIDDYRAALDAAGVTYTMHIYDGVNHAFHNDTSEARYDKDAAELAFSRTIDFFREKLG